MQEGLSQDEVALVLRRAAELDRDLGSSSEARCYNEAAVEQAALEAGLSQPAVRRALAEMRAGLLDASPRRPYRRILGPATITVCRTVPGPVAEVERHLHRFLHEQLFQLRRDHGNRTTWVRRRGLEASARRVIDKAVQRRLVLSEANHVDVLVVEHDSDWVLVRLDVDVLSIRHAQGTLAGGAAAVGGGIAATSAAVVGLDPALLMATGVGLGLASAGHWAGRTIYRSRVGEIEAGLGGVLDRLERRDRGIARGARGQRAV